MTKTELFALQGAANVLRDISAKENFEFKRLSIEFNVATINALDNLLKIEKLVTDHPGSFLDHPFWNGELDIEINYKEYEVGKSYIATWERDEENGEFNLEIYLEDGYGEDDPISVYSNYLSTSDISEDIETMRSLGFSIKVHPDYLPLKD